MKDSWTMGPALRELLVRAIIGECSSLGAIGIDDEGRDVMTRVLEVPDGDMHIWLDELREMAEDAERHGRDPVEMHGDAFDHHVVTTIQFFGLEAHARNTKIANEALAELQLRLPL